MNNLVDIDNMLINITKLAVYKNFITDKIGVKFLIFLESIQNDDPFMAVAEFYSDFIHELYMSPFRGNLSEYIKDFVLSDENAVSIDCAKQNQDKIPIFIIGAFEYELRILSDIASITFNDIRELLNIKYPEFKDAINSLPTFESSKLLFTRDMILDYYKTFGYGDIAKYSAFKLDDDSILKPVKTPDKITFDDLKLYSYQKNILLKNTESFIQGKPANNVLLYGDRGCGKSSSVKAIANKFEAEGLKIIQIYKEQIENLPYLIEYLNHFPSKFIIFIDDLVFNENDDKFARAKALLEGSLMANPKNTLIYATTNRRHLIKETFSSREGDEIHMNDTMDEASSLSDRFGITITFSAPDKKGYLEIVKELADDNKLNIKEDVLFREAEAFALLKGTRAPRIAHQFIICKISGNEI